MSAQGLHTRHTHFAGPRVLFEIWCLVIDGRGEHCANLVWAVSYSNADITRNDDNAQL